VRHIALVPASSVRACRRRTRPHPIASRRPESRSLVRAGPARDRAVALTSTSCRRRGDDRRRQRMMASVIPEAASTARCGVPPQKYESECSEQQRTGRRGNREHLQNRRRDRGNRSSATQSLANLIPIPFASPVPSFARQQADPQGTSCRHGQRVAQTYVNATGLASAGATKLQITRHCVCTGVSDFHKPPPRQSTPRL
jgi:hypothetical protein